MSATDVASNGARSSEDPQSFARYHETVARSERGQAPRFLFEASTEDLGNEPIDKQRYLSREFHDLEMEKLWKKVWQVACRLNDVPNVGDHVEYTIGSQSVFVVRVAPDLVKAYYNACRHRGTALVTKPGTSREFTCSFHGWTWNLDGSLKHIPCRWDWPELKDDDVRLREVKVAEWHGFVFINFDPDAQPLEDFLGPEIIEQFARWERFQMVKTVHVAKHIRCNWKLAVEAFIETYHVFRTHPELVNQINDFGADYAFYGPHARMLIENGAPSPIMGEGIDPQIILDEMLGSDQSVAQAVADGEAAGPTTPVYRPGDDVRHILSDHLRKSLVARTGIAELGDIATVSDTEVLDAMEYYVFPNLAPWGGYFYPIVYRFRPYENEPDKCIFEIMILSVYPEDAAAPADCAPEVVDFDGALADSTLGARLGYLLDEDMHNLVSIQRGLSTDGFDAVRFSNYQERNIRNMNRHIDRMLAE